MWIRSFGVVFGNCDSETTRRDQPLRGTITVCNYDRTETPFSCSFRDVNLERTRRRVHREGNRLRSGMGKEHYLVLTLKVLKITQDTSEDLVYTITKPLKGFGYINFSLQSNSTPGDWNPTNWRLFVTYSNHDERYSNRQITFMTGSPGVKGLTQVYYQYLCYKIPVYLFTLTM